MTPENIRFNLQKEWDISNSAWQAGETLRSTHLHRDAISRYYYAVFHAACAALLTHGIEPKSHSGARAEFHRLFVQSGLVERGVARAFGDLQKTREDADYSRELHFEQDDAADAAVSARDFRDAVAALLRSEGWMA